MASFAIGLDANRIGMARRTQEARGWALDDGDWRRVLWLEDLNVFGVFCEVETLFISKMAHATLSPSLSSA